MIESTDQGRSAQTHYNVLDDSLQCCKIHLIKRWENWYLWDGKIEGTLCETEIYDICAKELELLTKQVYQTSRLSKLEGLLTVLKVSSCNHELNEKTIGYISF